MYTIALRGVIISYMYINTGRHYNQMSRELEHMYRSKPGPSLCYQPILHDATPTYNKLRHIHDLGVVPQFRWFRLLDSRTSAPDALHQTSPPHRINRSTAPVGVMAGRTSR